MSQSTVFIVGTGSPSNRKTSKDIKEILNNIELCDQQGIQNPTVILKRLPIKVISFGMNHTVTRQSTRTLNEIFSNVLLETREGIRNPEIRMTRFD